MTRFCDATLYRLDPSIFHAERALRRPEKPRFGVQRRDNQLTLELRHLLDEALEPASVELGRRVVQKERRRRSEQVSQESQLGDRHRDGDQLLLPAGEHLARRAAADAQRKVRSVWTGVSGPACLVPRGAGSQRFEQGVLLSPSSDVQQLDLETTERRDRVPPVRLKLRDQALPGLRDRFAEAGQFRVPGARSARIELERGVTLLERSAVSGPGVDEQRFHVEHCPIEPASAAVATLFDEAMGPWLDNLYREGLGELGPRLHRPAVDPGESPLGGCLESQGSDLGRRIANVTSDSQLILSISNEAITRSCTKRSPAPEDENPLEERGLAGTVVSPDESQARRNLEVCLLDAAKVPDVELEETHADLWGRTAVVWT